MRSPCAVTTIPQAALQQRQTVRTCMVEVCPKCGSRASPHHRHIRASPTRTILAGTVICGMEAHRQLLDEVLLDHAPALARPTQFEARHARYERAPERCELHSGQCRPHAKMHAGTKCQMLTGISA